MTDTWFVLDDGSVGDPSEIAPDKAGVLRHKDGRAVAMAPHGPRTRGVDAEAERAKAAKAKPAVEKSVAPAPEHPKPTHHRTRDMKPEESAAPYKTR